MLLKTALDRNLLKMICELDIPVAPKMRKCVDIATFVES
jgi:hypothetical protein